MEEGDFDEVITHAFKPGDFAVITTDGFFEAAAPSGDQFGVERMMEMLQRDRDLPALRMIEKLCGAVERFTAGQPQADDLTAVIIRRR
jgi:serine phosphatase RsbU (regulator of sigma subunit)